MGEKSVLDVDENFLKRKVAKSKQTYHNEWILFQEVLQNSLDSIYKSERTDGYIEITMNLNDDSVIIKDNGIGFPHNPDLLLYGGSDKDESDEKIWKYGGSQGVGLKVVYFSSKEFSLTSVVNSKKWNASIFEGDKFTERDIQVKWDDEPIDVKEENGTVVKYKFSNDEEPGRIHAFLHNLYEIYYQNIEEHIFTINDWLKLGLLHYLRTETYAGNVRTLLNIPNVENIQIRLTIEYDLASYRYGDQLPEEIIPILESSGNSISIESGNKYWDIRDAINLTKAGVARPTLISEPVQPSGRGNRHNTNYMWHQNLTTPEQFESLLMADYQLRDQVDLQKYHDNLYDHISGIHILIGSTESGRLPRYLFGPAKRFISAKGVPTEHSIQTPTGVGEIGYVPYIHFIVDVSEELNEGKRTISNTRLVGWINNYFKDAYRVTLNHIVTRITGRKKRTSQRRGGRKKIEPTRDIVDRNEITLDGLSIKKIPEDEDTVIALFYELVGKGYLKGYDTYANHHNGQYDGHGIFIPPTDPTPREIERDTDLDILEFKIRLASIVEDFDKEDKHAEDIDLLVCWNDDLAEAEIDLYQVIYVDHSNHSEHPYHRVKKCLRAIDENVDIQILVLSEVIEQIRQEQMPQPAED